MRAGWKSDPTRTVFMKRNRTEGQTSRSNVFTPIWNTEILLRSHFCRGILKMAIFFLTIASGRYIESSQKIRPLRTVGIPNFILKNCDLHFKHRNHGQTDRQIKIDWKYYPESSGIIKDESFSRPSGCCIHLSKDFNICLLIFAVKYYKLNFVAVQ